MEKQEEKKDNSTYGLRLKSVLVTKEEMVEEDGDLQLCKIVPRAESGTKSKRKECAGSR
jgi:hypothetical protein